MADPLSKYFAPNYYLVINGKVMDKNFMSLVTSAEFEDESELMSSLKFTLKFQRNVIGGIDDSILSYKFLSPGNNVILKGGYGNELKDIGAGFIVDLEPNYSENGDPTMTVICYDNLYKLSKRKAEKGEIFDKYRDSQIASILGERHGFIISISDSSSYSGIRRTKGINARVQKRGSTDLAFLKELAKQNSYDLYCKWDGKKKRYALFFEPPRDRTKEVITFIYGQGNTPFNVTNVNNVLTGKLLSFKPKLSITNQYTKYKVYSWDKKGNKKISYTMSMDEFMRGQDDLKFGGLKADGILKNKTAVTSGAGVTQKAFGTEVETISTRTFETEEQARKYLEEHMVKLAKDFITGSAKISGNQYIQSRQIHKFGGLGAYFDGKYFMKKVTHRFDSSGYNCTLDVRKVLKEITQ